MQLMQTTLCIDVTPALVKNIDEDDDNGDDDSDEEEVYHDADIHSALFVYGKDRDEYSPRQSDYGDETEANDIFGVGVCGGFFYYGPGFQEGVNGIRITGPLVLFSALVGDGN